MQYQCLPIQQFQSPSGYSLIPLRNQDMESIRLWRNEQMDVLRQQAPIKPEEQKQYYNNVIIPSFGDPQPKQILFSFLQNNLCIGYGGLVHIDWVSRRAEISFLVDPSQLPHYYICFTEFLKLIHQVSFETLQFHRLFTETYSFRTGHIAILEKSGFILEGHLREHIYKDEEWHDSLIHGLLDKDPFNAA